MATPKKDPADLKSRGRKKETPAGASRRSILCTDAEYAALMDHLWHTIRGRARDASGRESTGKTCES